MTLNGRAACLGKRIDELKLNENKVEVQTLRRGDRTIDRPAGDQVLQDGDILILYGPLEAVEASEEKLLGG